MLYNPLWGYKEGYYHLSVYLYILFITYNPTVTGGSSGFHHYGATYEWLLTNLIPVVSGTTASRPVWKVRF